METRHHRLHIENKYWIRDRYRALGLEHASIGHAFRLVYTSDRDTIVVARLSSTCILTIIIIIIITARVKNGVKKKNSSPLSFIEKNIRFLDSLAKFSFITQCIRFIYVSMSNVSLSPLLFSSIERSDAPCSVRINVTYVRGSGAISGAIGTIAASKGHPVERSISRTRGALITNVTAIPPALEESLAEAERLISHRNRIINPGRSGGKPRDRHHPPPARDGYRFLARRTRRVDDKG